MKKGESSMKKLFALFLCAVMALSMACATAETAPEETGKRFCTAR